MYVCMYVGMCEAAFISFSCVPFVQVSYGANMS